MPVVSECRVWSLCAACLVSCAVREGPAVPLAARATAEPATSAGPTATAPVEREPELPLLWDCTGAPERVVDGTSLGAIVLGPADGAVLREADLNTRSVDLELPKLATEAQAMIALDHHPARRAEPKQSLRSLVTEWDPIPRGTHRLVVFWLDVRGLPIASTDGRALTSVSHFVVEAPSALPLGDWLLLAPAGTLNGATGPSAGYPRGLSLIALHDAAKPVALRISRGSLSRSGTLSNEDCALSVTESGDYRLELGMASGEHFERTITVNRDLGNP